MPVLGAGAGCAPGGHRVPALPGCWGLIGRRCQVLVLMLAVRVVETRHTVLRWFF